MLGEIDPIGQVVEDAIALVDLRDTSVVHPDVLQAIADSDDGGIIFQCAARGDVQTAWMLLLGMMADAVEGDRLAGSVFAMLVDDRGELDASDIQELRLWAGTWAANAGWRHPAVAVLRAALDTSGEGMDLYLEDLLEQEPGS